MIVTTGSQQALTLVAMALVRPGDRVLVEAPSYLAALQAFQLVGAVPVPVQGDEDGPCPEALAAAIDAHDPALLYLVPTFQNPTGRTIPAERRAALADVLAERGVWVIEDDPYGELRYDGEPVAPLAAEPAIAGQVIRVSSLSKVVAPGLRIGWIAAPPALHAALVIAKQATDLHTATVTQAAARHWLAAGRLDPQLALLRRTYRERRDAFVEALPQALPGGATFEVPQGGMFVWARLRVAMTPPSSCRRRCGTMSRSCLAPRSTRASPMRARCGCRSRRTRRSACARVCAGSAQRLWAGYRMPIRSTTKISVSFGPITPPAPCAP